MHPFHPKPVCGRLALLTLMGLAFDSQAATTLAQSSITLSNFAYQVTDLNAGDGITASATFDTSAAGGGVGMYVLDQLSTGVNTGGTVKYVPGSPFTTASATQTVSGITASASKSGSSFSTSASYNLGNLTGLIDAQPADMKHFAENSRVASVSEAPIFVTLSAHTSIQFSGTVSGSSLITADGFAATSSFAKVANAQASVTVGADSQVSIGLQDVTVPVDPLPSDGPQYVGLGVQTRTFIDSLGHIVNDGSNAPLAQAFTLKFTNDSDHSVVKELVLDVASNVYVFATPVPEASNMAMMALGLVGLAGLGWSRRASRS